MNIKYLKVVVLCVICNALFACGSHDSVVETPDGFDISTINVIDIYSKITKLDSNESENVGVFAVSPTHVASNVKYTKEASRHEWNTDTNIVLQQDKQYQIIVYYPYNQDVVSYTDIPITSSFGGREFMYSEPLTINGTEKSCTITLKQVMAKISITIETNNYVGDACLTQLRLTSPSIANAATLNATTSNITYKTTGEVLFDTPWRLAQGNYTKECYVIPVQNAADQPFEISCIIDGKTYTANLWDNSALHLLPGYSYNIEAVLSENVLEIKDIFINMAESTFTKRMDVGIYKDVLEKNPTPVTLFNSSEDQLSYSIGKDFVTCKFFNPAKGTFRTFRIDATIFNIGSDYKLTTETDEKQVRVLRSSPSLLWLYDTTNGNGYILAK